MLILQGRFEVMKCEDYENQDGCVEEVWVVVYVPPNGKTYEVTARCTSPVMAELVQKALNRILASN